jgi:pyrimidine-nucleoside phosphorylase
VGDKSSLLIAPVLAAAGMEGAPSISVPMISGRSLGHTGGTLDKLETIPGFDSQLSLGRMEEVLRECHAALVGQTPRLVPADRILYGMRDHTGTVESPFLICASIMSKKLAEDLRGLVLDVKVGSGAFMPTYERSKFLAELMVSTGEGAGTRTAALLTTMDEPLGRFSGNWVEVWECVDILKGVRHRMSADLIELANALSGWMLFLAGKVRSAEEGARLAGEILRSGAAYAAWLKIVAAQGGDTRVFDDPGAFHRPTATRVLRAGRAGYLADMDCKEVGWAVQRLGAGRARPGDPVGAHAGIESHAKLGDWVEAGQAVFTLFAEDEGLMEEPYRMMEATVKIAEERLVRPALVREVVTA